MNGTGKFINCNFENNYGHVVYGGGDFSNCSFVNNSKNPKSSIFFRCGAIFIGYSSIFKKCRFDKNFSKSGVVCLSSDAIFIESTFTNNSDVGAVGADYKGVGHFISCKFINNSTIDSGGAVNISRYSTFLNCLFINNSARKYGGAACLGNSYIINSTFYDNHAKDGGGAFYGDAKIQNSIFYKNKVGINNNDITVPDKLDIDYSLVNYLKGPANFGSHNIKGDPKFLDPANNGFLIQADSPCINVGKDLSDIIKIINQRYSGKFKLDDGIYNKDINGKSRIVDGKIDLGAYEYQIVLSD